MAALPGEGKKILLVAVFTLHPGKTVVQVAAIKITLNDLLGVGIRIMPLPVSGYL